MGIYHRPSNLKEALEILALDQVRIGAGCTDLLPTTDAQSLDGAVLDITAIDGLRGVTATGEGWRIGATTTWSDIVQADLPSGFAMLKAAAREIGSVQIQNAATVAGNICNASPAADGIPPLMALEAQVEIASQTDLRIVALGDFITDVRRVDLRADEMVTAVLIPQIAGLGVSYFCKLGARKYLVISIAMVAVRIVVKGGIIEQAAISVGACSPVARRLRYVEVALIGTRLVQAAQLVRNEDVAAALLPISDLRAEAAYRSMSVAVLLRRALGELANAAEVSL